MDVGKSCLVLICHISCVENYLKSFHSHILPILIRFKTDLLFRTRFRVSFTPHLYLSLVLFPHRLRFAFLGRVSKGAFGLSVSFGIFQIKLFHFASLCSTCVSSKHLPCLISVWTWLRLVSLSSINT